MWYEQMHWRAEKKQTNINMSVCLIFVSFEYFKAQTLLLFVQVIRQPTVKHSVVSSCNLGRTVFIRNMQLTTGIKKNTTRII